MVCTTVQGGGPQVVETARMAGESMLTWLREFDGYQGLVILADPETGTARFMTKWDSREAVQRSEQGRRQVRESMIAAAGAQLEQVELFEVVFDERVAEPVGAA
jgi:heme-degrading monooxygenase HmoA